MAKVTRKVLRAFAVARRGVSRRAIQIDLLRRTTMTVARKGNATRFRPVA
jgi:hypothetical protein